MRLLVTVVATVLLGSLSGCGGGGDGGGSAKATATRRAPRRRGARRGRAVRSCTTSSSPAPRRTTALGLIAHLSGAQAVSDTEGAGGGEYDDTLAAPKATTGLVKTGAVQFVGLRADTRHRPGRPTSTC